MVENARLQSLPGVSLCYQMRTDISDYALNMSSVGGGSVMDTAKAANLCVYVYCLVSSR